MTTTYIIQTIIEIIILITIIIGFIYEDKLITFEEKIKKLFLEVIKK